VCELPTELNELFGVMLGRISARHRAQAFRLLYITQQLLPHVNDAGLHALVLSYAEEYGYTTKALPPRGKIPSTELEERQQAIEVVVRSRCLGLLEVGPCKRPADSFSRFKVAEFKGLATNYTVDYIHKTVAEYLDEIDVQARVIETSAPTFDVNVAIINALVITCWHEVYSDYLQMFSHFNRQAEQSTEKAQSTAVNELDIHLSDPCLRDEMRVLYPHKVKSRSGPEGEHWANYVMEDYNRPCPWHDTLLAFAIRCGWELYVAEKLKEHGSGLPAKRGRPLLDYAIRPEPTYSPYVYGMSPKIVKCLLEHGADPNAKFNGYSAWSNALYYVDRSSFDTVLRRDNIAAHAVQVAEVMKLLLAYGAAKKAFCTSRSDKSSAAEVVQTAIDRSSDSGDEMFEEVRDRLREVLAMIEDSKGNRRRVHQASTIANDDGVSFAGSSRSEQQNKFLSQKKSMSQRIKAHLLKRRR
jgi:hypothetical protein